MQKGTNMQALYERFEISRLIAAELAQTITDSERNALRSWIDSSPANAHEYEQICARIKSGDSSFADEEQTAQAWSDFRKHIKPARRRLSWLKYAVAAILPLAAGIYFLNRTDNNTPVPLSQGVVSLVLDDGSRVLLADRGNRMIGESDGAMISVEDNTLTYTGADNVAQEIPRRNTLEVPNGCNFSLQLADGTRVWLNAGSKLVYPPMFSGQRRQVELEGEGYFEVSADENMPFVVEVDGVEVMVLGTAFNVSSFGGRVETTLMEGSVLLSKDEQQVTLLPNQQATWNDADVRFSLREVEARDYALWKDGVFWFEDARLDTIMEQLARWYDVEVVYRDPELRELRFSCEMKRYDRIETALRIIRLTKRFDIKVDGRTIVIFK